MLAAFLRNHPLANLTFGLVLAAGFLAYGMLPRQQDPTINFNWIVVTTVLPGASAQDVEKKVTDPLEDAIRSIGNMKFVSSTSRESVSSLLVRFDDIDERTFDKRLADLRREIQNAVQDQTGVNLVLIDDQTVPTREAIGLTTMAAFLPLMLLPGILGDFMRVIPMVVSIALAISLLEAFWMLPAHVIAMRVSFANPSRLHRWRTGFTHALQIRYVRALLGVLRWPRLSLAALVTMFAVTASAVASGMVRMDFFAADTLRLFYVNVEMPPATPLEDTLAKTHEIEDKVRARLEPGEARAIATYAGNMFTETEPRLGDQYGQILVGLNPKTPELRDVDAVIEAMRAEVTATPGPVQISFLRLAGGPPTSKPISVKVRGDDYAELRAAADTLKEILRGMDGVRDISDDAARGRS